MNQRVIYFALSAALMLLAGCGSSLSPKTNAPMFVEIEVQNHLVLHGFDENQKEILEEVTVDQPMKKLLRVDRIQSVSEKYILTTYGYGRLVYWEYTGSYEAMKKLLLPGGE